MLKTPTYDYEYWDLKFYYQIHCNRQKADGNIPLKYDQFIKRLKVMNLHDAIYRPRTYAAYDKKPKTPIQDDLRRMKKLKDENVQILSLDELTQIETPNLRKANKIQMPKPKQTLRHRFTSLFR